MYHVSYSVFKEQKDKTTPLSSMLHAKDPEDTRMTLYVLVACRYQLMYAHKLSPPLGSVNPHKYFFPALFLPPLHPPLATLFKPD